MRNLLRVAVVLAGSLLTLPAGAQAGSYVINDCPSASSSSTPGPWVVFGSPAKAKTTCSGGLGDYIGPLGSTIEPFNGAGVKATVPTGSGITIKEAKAWWAVPRVEAESSNNYAIVATNTTLLHEYATPFGEEPSTYAMPAETTSLTLEDYCTSDYYGHGCTIDAGEPADLEMYGAQLTLTDSGSPSGSATGGGLAGEGPVSGKQSLDYTAEDKGSGVLSAELLVDGKSASKKSFSGKCTYANFAACPGKETGSLGYETKKATNGSHEVALQITSAGDNSATVDAHKIIIEN